MREELQVKPEGDQTAKTAAGHRAIESERPEAERMCYDPYADKVVGQEGRGYAERVKETLLDDLKMTTHTQYPTRPWACWDKMKELERNKA